MIRTYSNGGNWFSDKKQERLSDSPDENRFSTIPVRRIRMMTGKTPKKSIERILSKGQLSVAEVVNAMKDIES